MSLQQQLREWGDDRCSAGSAAATTAPMSRGTQLTGCRVPERGRASRSKERRAGASPSCVHSSPHVRELSTAVTSLLSPPRNSATIFTCVQHQRDTLRPSPSPPLVKPDQRLQLCPSKLESKKTTLHRPVPEKPTKRQRDDNVP